MKIGLVLFGHLRSFRKTHESFLALKSILAQQGELDIFCHTWNIEESVSAAWWKSHDPDSPPPATVDEKEIISKYDPVLYEVEPSKQFEEPELGIKSLVPLAGMLSMLYSQLKAFELLKKHEQQTGQIYDVIIKSRYDILYEIAPLFSLLPRQAFENNCIYLPSSNPYELAGAFSDIFAIGSREKMEAYFSFNDHLNEAAEIFKKAGYREMVPEVFMSVYLKKKNIPVHETKGIRIQILRASGEKFPINTDMQFENNTPLCFYKPSVEKCINLLPEESGEIEINNEHLVKKYIGWLLPEADEKTLDDYRLFNKGNWISLKKITKLLQADKKRKVLASHVLRDFFEMALWNARYSFFKKILFASMMVQKSKYGLLYFNIIRKKNLVNYGL